MILRVYLCSLGAGKSSEKSNSTIKNYLRKDLNNKESKHPDWDLWLQKLCYAYNTSIYSSTGFSPAELMFGGRKIIVPIDILYGSRSDTHYSFESFKQELQVMYDLARDQMKLRQSKAASYVDSKNINTTLQINDNVLIFDYTSNKDKLTLRWNGPFNIVVSHPCYQINTPKCLQWLPQDRIRKVPHDFASVDDGEGALVSDNAQANSDDGDDDDINHNETEKKCS